jgi:hypothetical protein
MWHPGRAWRRRCCHRCDPAEWMTTDAHRSPTTDCAPHLSASRPVTPSSAMTYPVTSNHAAVERRCGGAELDLGRVAEGASGRV